MVLGNHQEIQAKDKKEAIPKFFEYSN